MLTLSGKLGPVHYGTCGALLNGPDCGATRPPTMTAQHYLRATVRTWMSGDREKSYLPSLRARRPLTPGDRSCCALRIPAQLAEKPGTRAPRRLAPVRESVISGQSCRRQAKELTELCRRSSRG